MTSKRTGLLTGALLLGTAGLAAAQDPTTTPTPSPTAVAPGGMMGGQNGASMMGGQNGASMMGGQNGASMMGGQMGTMSADQLKQMAAIHNEMAKGGALDVSQMQALHAQHHPSR